MTEMELKLREIAPLQSPGARLVTGVVSPAVYTKPIDVARKRTRDEKRARQRIYNARFKAKLKAQSK